MYAELPSLPTNPFFFSSPDASGNPKLRTSVRSLLQDFLLQLERGKPSTVSNILSSAKKLRDSFGGWGADSRGESCGLFALLS